MNFSLKQIRYFVATAQLGQVSRAADQLRVTQSAVTISIRDLEGELGYPLFRREAHGMALTDDGREFLSHALAIETAVERAGNIARSKPVAGELTLAATTTVVGYFLPEHIQRLSEPQHPHRHTHRSHPTRLARTPGICVQAASRHRCDRGSA